MSTFSAIVPERAPESIRITKSSTDPALTRHLVKLDRLGLIELQLHDHVRLKVPKLLRLQPGGPIHRVHGARVFNDVIAAELDATLPSRQRETTGLLVAVRRWELSRVSGLSPRVRPAASAARKVSGAGAAARRR